MFPLFHAAHDKISKFQLCKSKDHVNAKDHEDPVKLILENRFIRR